MMNKTHPCPSREGIIIVMVCFKLSIPSIGGVA